MEQAVATLLGGAAGSFFYHLLILFAVEAGLALAYGAYRRSRGKQELALVWAWGGMLAIRTAAIALSIFGWTAGTPAEGFWSLGGLIDTATVFLLVWGFVLAPQFPVRTAWAALAAGTAICLGAGVLAYPAVGLLDGVLTWLVLQACFLAVGLVFVWRRDQDRWSIFAFLFILSLAVALEAVLGGGAGEMQVWQRLGQLVALPLAVAATYAIVQRSQQYATLPSLLEETGPASSLRRLLAFFETLHQSDAGPGLSSVLEGLAEGVARCLQADECAVILAEDSVSDALRLGAVYNPARTGQGEAVALPLEDQHVLRKALRQQKPVSVPNAAELVQLQILLALMGAPGSGPVLILPLALEDNRPGAIVASRTQSGREFGPEEADLGMRLAGYASASVGAARRYGALEQQAADMKAELRNREIELQEHKTDVHKQIARSKSEAELFSQRLYELEKELEEKEEVLKGARLEAAQGMAGAQQAREEAEALSRKLEEAVRERLRLEERLQADEWKQHQEGEQSGRTEE